MLDDKQFLHWIADRLHFVYGESNNVDFILKLRSIAETLGDGEYTPNGYKYPKEETK